MIGHMRPLPQILRDMPIFAELGDPVLDRLAQRCVPRAVGSGFTLFRAGDRCSGLYIVLEGRVRIYRTSPEGKEQTLAVEGPGRPVAELPLFDGGTYPASGVTTVASRLAFLPRAEFEHAFRTDPDVASAVVKSLGTRLRHLVQLVETVAFRDVAARLAMLLADYADHQGTADGDEVTLELERTQEELATEIGTARESVSRAFKQLQSRGLIHERKGTHYRLAATDALRAWARGEET
jgi:CRP-like cAMP-binding protein